MGKLWLLCLFLACSATSNSTVCSCPLTTALIWAVNESRLKRSLRALSTWSERESPLLLRNAILEGWSVFVSVFLSNRQ